MKAFIKGPMPERARNLMRKIGYGEHRGYGGQLSYTRRLRSDSFPRFHAYVEERDGGMQLNLHLDQQKHNVAGNAHKGEYDGPLVEKEMSRIKNVIRQMKSGGAPQKSKQPKTQPKSTVKKTRTKKGDAESKFW